MKWEELEVYTPLLKTELKSAFKDFIDIISVGLNHFGFKLIGRKLYKISNDLLHIIYIDTRGSWTGINEHFKIEIAIVHVCNKSPFIRGWELTGTKTIEDLIPRIRNHYRITKEFPLLAEFLILKISEHLIPYFNNYDTSVKILNNRRNFRLDDLRQQNNDLILFCELWNKINVDAIKIINKILERSISQGEYLDELNSYKSWIIMKDYDRISEQLFSNRTEVLKKLKIKVDHDQ